MATVLAYLFENTKRNLIQELRKASKTIQVAVAWFTDEDLMAELMNLKYQQKGLSIEAFTRNLRTCWEIEKG